MDQQKRSTLVTGATLILIGLGLFTMQYFQGIGQSVILFLVGGLCVAGYLFRGYYALLVIGGVLMGLGLGSIGARKLTLSGDFREIGLGAGFLSIYAIALLHRGRSHWWPLLPGTLLVATGAVTSKKVFSFLFSSRGWPLIIVFVGLLVLLGAIGRPKKRKGNA